MCTYLFLSLILFSWPINAALQEEKDDLLPKKESRLSTSPKKFSSPSVQRHSSTTEPRTPWTLDDTGKFIAFIQEQKIWGLFFKVLASLPNPEGCPPGFASSCYPSSSSSSLHEPYHTHQYPAAYFQGATFRTGQCTVLQLTHTGLVMQAINNGTLLKALREASNKKFTWTIELLEAKIDP